jgi:hypothetical protein
MTPSPLNTLLTRMSNNKRHMGRYCWRSKQSSPLCMPHMATNQLHTHNTQDTHPANIPMFGCGTTPGLCHNTKKHNWGILPL